MSGRNIKESQENVTPPPSPASAARLIVRRARKAALATLDRRSGHPYASLVTIATEPWGGPVLLISRLALHTQNLEADRRASLLMDETSAAADPLAGGRVSLIGHLAPAESTSARRRFLSRHPAAEMYAGFPDFSFYAFAIQGAHYIGGFGRIVDLTPRDLLLEEQLWKSIAEAEAEIVSHMNEDHAGAIALYATVLCGAPGGPWRMIGIDPEGCDLACDGDVRRLTFAKQVTTPGEARAELVRLAAEARAQAPKP